MSCFTCKNGYCTCVSKMKMPSSLKGKVFICNAQMKCLGCTSQSTLVAWIHTLYWVIPVSISFVSKIPGLKPENIAGLIHFQSGAAKVFKFL